MSGSRRNHADDLRGVTRLVVEATEGIAAIVEDMQGPTLGIAGLVHRSIRGVTRFVGGGVDALLAPFVHLLGDTRSRPEMEAVLAALNGVIGDHLAATGNPLAIPMRLRKDGVPLELDRRQIATALPDAGGRILILIHGSCMNDLRWSRRGHEHGAALARDLGVTPLHLHYNSGLHISTSGKEFAALLERLVEEWPVPVEELVILAHSMGGLVARSAFHQAERAGQRWPGQAVEAGLPGHPTSRGSGRAARQLGERRPLRRPLHRRAGPPAKDPQRRHHRPAPRQPPRRGLARARPVPARARPAPPRASSTRSEVLRHRRQHGEGAGRSAEGRRPRPGGQRAGAPRRPGAGPDASRSRASGSPTERTTSACSIGPRSTSASATGSRSLRHERRHRAARATPRRHGRSRPRRD